MGRREELTEPERKAYAEYIEKQKKISKTLAERKKMTPEELDAEFKLKAPDMWEVE